MKHNIVNWNDPAARLSLVERIGIPAYNAALDAHHKALPDIYPVQSRFGTLYAVKGTTMAFTSRALAEKHLAEEGRK